MKRSSKPPDDTLEVQDEPGMAERFQRGLQRALNTPPTHRTPKERTASNGRARKGKMR
jgi:hypothetical protein